MRQRRMQQMRYIDIQPERNKKNRAVNIQKEMRMPMRYMRRGIGILAAVLLLTACGDNAGESVQQTVDMNVIKTYEHKVIPETKEDEPGGTGDTSDTGSEGGQSQSQTGENIDGFTETNDVVVVAVSKLNLRTGPSTDAEIVAQVKYGDTFTRLAKGDNGWDQLLYGDRIVYAFAEYLSESTEPQQDGRQSLEYYAAVTNVKKN